MGYKEHSKETLRKIINNFLFFQNFESSKISWLYPYGLGDIVKRIMVNKKILKLKRKFSRKVKYGIVSPNEIIEEAKTFNPEMFCIKYRKRKADIYFSILVLNPHVVLPSINSHFITLRVLQLFAKGHIHKPVLRRLDPNSFWSITKMSRHVMMLLFKAAEMDDPEVNIRDIDERIFNHPADRPWLCLYLDEMAGGSDKHFKEKNNTKSYNLAPFAEAMNGDFKKVMKYKKPLNVNQLNRLACQHHNYVRAIQLSTALETLLTENPYIESLARSTNVKISKLDMNPKARLLNTIISEVIDDLIAFPHPFQTNRMNFNIKGKPLVEKPSPSQSNLLLRSDSSQATPFLLPQTQVSPQKPPRQPSSEEEEEEEDDGYINDMF